MHDLAATRVRDTTALSPEQRERLRREGRIARAVEAAQRRSGGRAGRESKPRPGTAWPSAPRRA
jgi:hypothetical protein